MIIQKKCLIGLVFVVMLGMSFFYEGRYVRAVASNDGEMTSCLPQIRIKTNDNIGNSLTKDRGYVNAGFEVIQTPESTIETTGEIKVRGNTTSLAKKKPYTIKFSSKTDLFGMGTAKKWVLLANAYDPSLLRNYIAFDLAQKLDLSYTTKQRYVDVWMDGEELGSYLLVEPVEVGKTRVDLDLEQGDFMVEYEAGRVEYGATYIVTPEKKIRFVCSEPETPTEVELQHMTDIWNQAEQAICSGDYQRVCAIIDINSFVNLYLLNEYMKTVDFGFSSVFIYYKNGKLYAGPAWDYDLSSGNASNIAYPTYNTGENGNYEDLWAIDNLLWKLILSYPQVDEVCKLRFAEVAKTFQSVYMPNGVIDQICTQNLVSFLNTYSLTDWSANMETFNGMREAYETWEQNVDFLRNWLHNRYRWLVYENWHINEIAPDYYDYLCARESAKAYYETIKENIDDYRNPSKLTELLKDNLFDREVVTDVQLYQATEQLCLVTNHLQLKQKFEITFKTNSDSAITSLNIREGDEIPTLTIPEKEGFKFLGWYIDAGCTKEWKEALMPRMNVTLYAAWEKVPVIESMLPSQSTESGMMSSIAISQLMEPYASKKSEVAEAKKPSFSITFRKRVQKKIKGVKKVSWKKSTMVNPKSLVLYKRKNAKVKFTIKNVNKKAKYSVNHKKIAIISPKGYLTVRKAGKIVVTIKLGTYKWRCKIKIKP